MSTLKTVEELVQTRQYFSSEVKSLITQDRHSLHTSLVAAVEGKEKDSKKAKESQDGELIAAIIGYNQALDDTLTIINSIFKE